MANDLSLTGRNAPMVEVEALFRSLVYQRVALSDDHSPQTRIMLDDSSGGQTSIVHPQLAGLLAIVSSDIIHTINTAGTGVVIHLASGTGHMHADFRFSGASNTENAGQVLSSVMESGWVAGTDPDIRIQSLPVAPDQEPGLRLTFQAIPGQPA
jgi:hypothetical protein